MDAVTYCQVKHGARGAVLDVRLALSAVHILVALVLQGVEAVFPRTEAAGPWPWRLETRPHTTFYLDQEVTMRLGF